MDDPTPWRVRKVMSRPAYAKQVNEARVAAGKAPLQDENAMRAHFQFNRAELERVTMEKLEKDMIGSCDEESESESD